MEKNQMNEKESNNKRGIRRRRQKKNQMKMWIAFAAVIVIVIAVCVGVFLNSKKEEKQPKEVKGITITAKTVDNDSLKKLLSDVKSITTDVYTSDSVETLNNAVEEANAILKSKPSQTELDQAYINIVNAIQALQKNE